MKSKKKVPSKGIVKQETTVEHRQGVDTRRVTTRTIREMKTRGEKVTMITAYDYTFARLFDQAARMCCSSATRSRMLFRVTEPTIPVTLDEMIYHARLVVRGVQEHAMVICDMPFMSFQVSVEEGFRNAGRIMKETGAGGVKIEGGQRVADHVRRMSEAGIPVIRAFRAYSTIHPSILKLPDARYYKRRIGSHEKRCESSARCRCFCLSVGKNSIRGSRKILRFAESFNYWHWRGPHCDGQVLVMHDMLGFTEEFHPRFVRKYASLAETVRTAVRNYDSDIKNGTFPSEAESY